MFLVILYWFWLVHSAVSLVTGQPDGFHGASNETVPDDGIIPDEYVVTLYDNHTLGAHFQRIGVDLSQTTGYLTMKRINSCVAHIPDKKLRDAVHADVGVRHMESNLWVDLVSEVSSSHFVPGNSSDLDDLRKRDDWGIGINTRANWGERVANTWDRLIIPVEDGQLGYVFENAGEGTDIYILDTGIQIGHKWFNGQAEHFEGRDHSVYANGESADDFHGHGTHVAGIATRIAPGAKIVNVKVWYGERSAKLGSLGAAINDIIDKHIDKLGSSGLNYRGAVINMSMRCARAFALDLVMNKAHLEGVVLVTTAGNDPVAGHETNQYPCIHPSTICVGSIDRKYQQSYFSNWGSNVDLLAPGSNIISASNTGDNDLAVKSGTSMAAPLVAGLLASYVSWEHISSDANLAYGRLIDNTQRDVIFGLDPTTKNRLANSGIFHPDKDKNKPYKGAPANRVQHEGDPLLDGHTADPFTTTHAAEPAMVTIPPVGDGFIQDMGDDQVQPPPITKVLTGIDDNGQTVVIVPVTAEVTPVPAR